MLSKFVEMVLTSELVTYLRKHLKYFFTHKYTFDVFDSPLNVCPTYLAIMQYDLLLFLFILTDPLRVPKDVR